MKEHNVALCPTLAAGDAIVAVRRLEEGRRPGARAAARRSARASRRRSTPASRFFSGSDVGVFAHGDNARELELMVDYGMPAHDALKRDLGRRARAPPGECSAASVRACSPT